MALCGKTSVAVFIILVALLARFFWDSRDPLVKADSIIFVKQQFDQRFDTPGGRVCFFDLPNDDDKGVLSPIIFLIHGKSSNADDMKTIFGADAISRARKEGFVVVYPVGVMVEDGMRTWNAGSVDSHNDANEIEYFSQVVAHLAANFNADPQNVFLSGMSNGGFMTHRLACAWASESQAIRVRAIAPTLGGLAKMQYDAKCAGDMIKMGAVPIPFIRIFDQDACPYEAWRDAPSHFECDALKDVPALIVNNGKDVLVLWSGSVIAFSGELYPPVEYTLRFYAEANGCDYVSGGADGREESFRRVSVQDPDDITTCHSLRNCRANTTLCVSHNSGHNWVFPSNGDEPAMPSRFFHWLMSPYAKTVDTSHEILRFFSQHRKN